MIAVRELVTGAFRNIGETMDVSAVDGDQVLLGIQHLNALIGTLNLEHFFEQNQTILDYVPTTSKRVYMVGPAQPVGQEQPDIETPLPDSIVAAYWSTAANGAPVEIRKCGIADILRFSLPLNSSSIPQYFCYSSSVPLGALRFTADLPADGKLQLVVRVKIPKVEDFNDLLPLGDEYIPALQYGLAWLLAEQRQCEEGTIAAQKRAYMAAHDAITDRGLDNDTPLGECPDTRSGFDIYNFGAAPGRFF
ncbi:MAG: hypothetical protein IIZ06_01955 [Kiritimatiellae bacterium]|nr:hypothetical protein [Kiritimatiellia bacterium]